MCYDYFCYRTAGNGASFLCSDKRTRLKKTRRPPPNRGYSFGIFLQMKTSRLQRESGWLGMPPLAQIAGEEAATALIDASSQNSFIRFRKLLWSYHKANERGWSDEDFVSLVLRLDEAVQEVDGRGFSVTPFDSHPELASAVGAEELWIKDETVNVGSSHKARHLLGLALHLEIDEVPRSQPLAIASCGNAALGAAIVAKATDRPLTVFAPTSIESEIHSELDRLEARVNLCERQRGEAGDPAFLRFKEALIDGAIAFSVQGPENIWTLDGGRILGWELAEAFAEARHEFFSWLFVQVGGGALASCIVQGMQEARDLKMFNYLPRICAVQTYGCAPLARAMNLIREKVAESSPREALIHAVSHPEEYMWPWEEEPRSIASGILDDETYDWLPIAWGIVESGGQTPIVSDKQIRKALKLAQKHTDIPIGPTGVSALAGLTNLAELQTIANAAVLFTGVT